LPGDSRQDGLTFIERRETTTPKTKRRPAKTQRSRGLKPGIRFASKFQFFLYEANDLGDPTWTVYERGTGLAIAKFSPVPGRCRGLGRFDDEGGCEGRFSTVFAQLRRMVEEG
jgi:hypothetical protein